MTFMLSCPWLISMVLFSKIARKTSMKSLVSCRWTFSLNSPPWASHRIHLLSFVFLSEDDPNLRDPSMPSRYEVSNIKFTEQVGILMNHCLESTTIICFLIWVILTKFHPAYHNNCYIWCSFASIHNGINKSRTLLQNIMDHNHIYFFFLEVEGFKHFETR